MKSQVKTKSQNIATKNGMTGSVALLALFRLALLVGPETMIIKSLSHSPLVCVLAAVMFLGIWLSVDVWPFRAETSMASKVAVPKQVKVGFSWKAAKTQGVNYVFGQAMMLMALVQSKLTV